jgi:hypothetical protein
VGLSEPEPNTAELGLAGAPVDMAGAPAPAAKHPFRDENGRFLVGNPGGPGQPRKKLDYIVALNEEVPLEKWRAIVQQAVSDALNTKQPAVRAEARRWLAGFLCPDQARVNVAVAVGGGSNGSALDLDRFLADPGACDLATALVVRLGSRALESGGACLEGVARDLGSGEAPRLPGA